MCGTVIPMCWKCSSAVLKDVGGYPGVKELDHCKENPQITCFEHAMALCPLTHEKNKVQ